MANHGEPKGQKPPFLRLDEIEEEGEQAVHRRARELFSKCMETGGAIDWSALSRGGPAVYQALLTLMSKRAAMRPSSGTATRTAIVKVDSVLASNPKAKTPAKRASSRVKRNWRDRRTQAIDFRWKAFRAGAAVNTTVSVAAFAVIWWLKI